VHHPHPEPPNRRTFLHWALHGLGALFAVVFGVPIVGYLIDPRNRPRPPGDFRPVSGIKLSELSVGVPVQGVIRSVRFDSWTLYPDDVIGRVFVVRKPGPATAKESYEVFSTTCPHLGCSINENPNQLASPGFTCPCHNGRFALDGSRIDPNPATRGMYALEFELSRDPANPDDTNKDLLRVKYVLPTTNAADAPKA
jgi:menaquinol-cytochrome c reductase iron-sulfur subunit